RRAGRRRRGGGGPGVIFGLYQSAAGMMVNEYRQAVIANNLANAETPAFKRDVATFSERQIAAVAGVRGGAAAPPAGASHELLDGLSGGIWLGETHTDYGEG